MANDPVPPTSPQPAGATPRRGAVAGVAAWLWSRRWVRVATAYAVILGACVSVALVLRAGERQALRPAWAGAAGESASALADLTAALRAMKLVSVELRTRVSSKAEHTSWRGDVVATVDVPARLYYGTDLYGAEVSLDRSISGRPGYTLRLPPPRRIAAELELGPGERAQVELGWLRTRSRAGEYYLGEARRGLSAALRRLRLTPEDEAFVRRETRHRVAELVRTIAGPEARVSVLFSDE
jgi:hypothetical protein